MEDGAFGVGSCVVLVALYLQWVRIDDDEMRHSVYVRYVDHSYDGPPNMNMHGD